MPDFRLLPDFDQYIDYSEALSHFNGNKAMYKDRLEYLRDHLNLRAFSRQLEQGETAEARETLARYQDLFRELSLRAAEQSAIKLSQALDQGDIPQPLAAEFWEIIDRTLEYSDLAARTL